jgi:hypothetical protein
MKRKTCLRILDPFYIMPQVVTIFHTFEGNYPYIFELLTVKCR